MKILVPFAAACMVVVGCSDNSSTRSHSQSRSQRTVQGSLLSFSDFDLETVVAVVKENKVNGAQELEKFINSDNGVNNVDVDKDGKIDYVRVVEGRSGSNITLDMQAKPTSGGEEVTVANLTFSQTAGSEQLTVQGGYPSYVDGHQNHHYSYSSNRSGLSVGEAVFLAWLLSPGRTMYMQPYPTYTPRPVYTSSNLQSRRTTTRTTTKVSPVKSATKPSSYSIKSAQKTQSRLKNTGVSSFQKRGSNEKKAATGFSRTPSRSSSSSSSNKPAAKPAPKKKSGSSWGRSSGSRSRSRSWGRSGGSRGGRRSSLQYKSNVHDFSVGMDAIRKMNAVKWDWKDGADEPNVGFIAEDMAKVFPEAVIRNESNEVIGLDYSLMVVPLINSVKELRQEVDQLKNNCQ